MSYIFEGCQVKQCVWWSGRNLKEVVEFIGTPEGVNLNHVDFVELEKSIASNGWNVNVYNQSTGVYSGAASIGDTIWKVYMPNGTFDLYIEKEGDISKGQILIQNHGEYEQRGITDCYLALADFNIKFLESKYKEDYSGDSHAFFRFLSDNGYVKLVHYHEFDCDKEVLFQCNSNS